MARHVSLPGPLTLLLYRAGEVAPTVLRLDNGDRLDIDVEPNKPQGRVFSVILDDHVKVRDPGA